MAKFRVMQRSFIDGSIVEEGAIVEYSGEPSENLKPVSNKEAAAQADSFDAGSEQAAV